MLVDSVHNVSYSEQRPHFREKLPGASEGIDQISADAWAMTLDLVGGGNRRSLVRARAITDTRPSLEVTCQ
jgi:hypothetical protein